MDWLTFWTKVIEALAWPVAVLIVAILVRRPLAQLLPQVSKLKYKDFEAEFGKQMAEIKAQLPPGAARSESGDALLPVDRKLEELAAFAPNAAILEAWKQVEAAAKALLEKHGHRLDYDVATPYRLIERVLEDGALVERRALKVFGELRRLRNKVAHADDYEVSSEHAREYIALATSLRHELEVLAARDERAEIRALR